MAFEKDFECCFDLKRYMLFHIGIPHHIINTAAFAALKAQIFQECFDDTPCLVIYSIVFEQILQYILTLCACIRKTADTAETAKIVLHRVLCCRCGNERVACIVCMQAVLYQRGVKGDPRTKKFTDKGDPVVMVLEHGGKGQDQFFKGMVKKDGIAHHTAGAEDMPQVFSLAKNIPPVCEVGRVQFAAVCVMDSEIRMDEYGQCRMLCFAHLHMPHLFFQFVALPNIVLVAEGNVGCMAKADEFFEVPDVAQRRLVPVQDDIGVLGEEGLDNVDRCILGIVVANNELKVGIGLRYDRPDLLCNELFAIVGGQQYGEGRGLRMHLLFSQMYCVCSPLYPGISFSCFVF